MAHQREDKLGGTGGTDDNVGPGAYDLPSSMKSSASSSMIAEGLVSSVQKFGSKNF